MKAPKHRKGVALAVAGVVVAAGAVAIDLPALANTNKGKAATSKTVKTKTATSKTVAKSGSTTPPAIGDNDDNDGDGPHGFGPGGPGATQALTDVLADLVSKGTITQGQSDAITSALQAKRDAMQKAEESIRSQAAAIIAGVLGLTVDEFNTKRANHTLPEPTDAQRQEIKTKLDALRTSLGLPAGGPGGGPHDGGPGMGRPGDDGPGMGAPGMGMRGHGHHGGPGF